MTDDDKLRDSLNRAQQANDLLQNELLIEAYDQIDAELVGAWRLTAARDTDARERIWAAVQANAKHDLFQFRTLPRQGTPVLAECCKHLWPKVLRL